MYDANPGLASLDPETFERPDSRLGNAANARHLVNRLKWEDNTRMFRYTKIQGLMDGNPPWSSKRLEDLGQGHRANFNLRESEGIVEAAKTPYYDLVFEVPSFARIEFGVEGAESYLLDQWNDIISEEYSDVLNGWDGFDHEMQLHQWQMVVNGVGPMFWPHYIGWHSEALKARKVLVPQETKANVEQLELCAVLHSYRADELEMFIKRGGTEDPKGDGWNIPLCRQAIVDSAMREMRQTYGIENYDLYQRAIRTGDLFYGIHRSNRIFVASVFVKEFGGKVSHYMVTDQNLGHTNETYDSTSDETGYLFKRRNKFDSFAQVFCPFFFDSGPDGTWHAIKGLGPKIYDFCDISNRTFCQMLDGSVIGSGITLETQDSNAMEETQIALVGGAAVVSPGYKVVQTRIAESLDGAMAMRRELHGTLQANTGSYRQRTDEGGSRAEPTLGQAELVQQQQGMLTKGSTNRYYNNLDKWNRETLRRLMDPAQSPAIPGGREAMTFMQRCIQRGIPEQILKFSFVQRITATRSIGYGSPQLRDIATRELMNMIPYMDEVSRNHALRARASALPGIGMHSVDSFFPPIEKSGVPNAHAALAVLENNALRQQGGKALVEPMQNHSIHFDTHFQDAMAHAQQGGIGMPQIPPPMPNQGPSGVLGPTMGMNGGNASPPGSGPGTPSPAPVMAPSRNGVPPQPPQGQGQGQNGSGAPTEDPVKILQHLENAGPHMFQHLAGVKRRSNPPAGSETEAAAAFHAGQDERSASSAGHRTDESRSRRAAGAAAAARPGFRGQDGQGEGRSLHQGTEDAGRSRPENPETAVQ